MPARPLIVRCGALGDMVLLTTLIRLVSARHGSPVDLVSSGGWTAPLLQAEPALGHLQLVTSRNTPYWLCPSQWALVRWLRQRGRGPVYLADVNGDMPRLLARGGVHPDDIVARRLEDDALPMLWPDRWLALGQQDPAHPYPTVPVQAGEFRMPRLVVPAHEREALLAWRAQEDLAGPLVLFQPGNKRTHKRGKVMTADHPKHWDPERWAAVANDVLQALPDGRVLLCGSPPEHGLLEDIRAAAGNDPRIRNLANDLPIPRMLAVLEVAHSMVSVDTGPAHAAAALECPLVVMFGAAPPERWRPIGNGPITVLGGERGDASRVQDIAATRVIEAWRALPGRGSAGATTPPAP
ncbi:glycosyltransferase family 9 protein [uncultured Luteimonas sp.]|uniref:glycosyltransferase family 9 protein n=1 Tax=uncultured Luteimonas sp. TaxID=453144 RepID=UPI0026035ECF|nr:glycosyltransferase family 9 protein [uncultured Luteimonas sp.]